MRKDSQHNLVKWKYVLKDTRCIGTFQALAGVGEVTENGEAASPRREVVSGRSNPTLFDNLLMALLHRQHGAR